MLAPVLTQTFASQSVIKAIFFVEEALAFGEVANQGLALGAVTDEGLRIGTVTDEDLL